MLESKLKLLVAGVSAVMAFSFAPLAGGTGLTTHQNHGKEYYYDGRQLPYHNSSRYGWDRGSGYRRPPGESGYHHPQGYSHGYYQPYQPPYDYHGRAYYPYSPQSNEETLSPSRGPQDFYQGYDQGYHDGYRDAPKPHSGGVIYLYKGTE